ncbi:MAG: tetratricopeptide repeat protein [Chitinophagales bacterium]|nr:tetratricopeptide repeat protein [Chitinophagales bacterium]MDW8428027.1 tetratricopeptide repeat protein [Chitinophagales bacterium]
MDATTRVKLLLQLLQEKPQDAFLLYALALEYKQMGDGQTARDYFVRLKHLHPDYLGLYYHLGNLYQQMGMVEEARHTYREGISRCTPSDERTRQELIQALNQLEEETE